LAAAGAPPGAAAAAAAGAAATANLLGSCNQTRTLGQFTATGSITTI
jgi:hypothetical protein